MRSDELFAINHEAKKNDPTFVPITHEELVIAQLSDPFCIEVRQKLNTGTITPFGFTEDGLLVRQVTNDQVVIPHNLKERVLHIHHYSRLSGHPGGRKLYMSIKTSHVLASIGRRLLRHGKEISNMCKESYQTTTQEEPAAAIPSVRSVEISGYRRLRPTS